jgi:pyruvate/2-oxoglutarate dehydrogenase complex dihydrolipoamide acyltransferase (E2) component
VPGVLVFSLRLLVEALLVPVRGVLRAFGVGRHDADRYEPAAAEPPAPAVAAQPRPAARPAARKRPPQRRATPRRAEPTRGEVAAMREAAREAETGGADSVGAQVHVAEPWAGYDEMRLDEILARLEDATDVELAVVNAYERGHEARQAILLAAGEEA